MTNLKKRIAGAEVKPPATPEIKPEPIAEDKPAATPEATAPPAAAGKKEKTVDEKRVILEGQMITNVLEFIKSKNIRCNKVDLNNPEGTPPEKRIRPNLAIIGVHDPSSEVAAERVQWKFIIDPIENDDKARPRRYISIQSTGTKKPIVIEVIHNPHVMMILGFIIPNIDNFEKKLVAF